MPYKQSNTRKFFYDNLGRVIEIIDYQYNENMERSMDSRTRFTYDIVHSRITNITIQLGASYDTDFAEVHVFYDQEGYLTQMASDHGSSYYRFEKRK